MISIYDAKEKQMHKISIKYIKMIELTKSSVRIIFKDQRTPDMSLKSSQITFED